MEPLKINIEVSLSEATIAALKGIFGAQIIAAPAKVEEPAPEPKKAAKKRGVAAKTIRQYIHDTFGVETSVECPENRRQELIDGLANLAA